MGGDADGIPIGGATRSSMMGPLGNAVVHMGLGDSWVWMGDCPMPCWALMPP